MTKQIWVIRDIFAGDQIQHEEILEKAKDFLSSPEPGVFVVGGTRITGKTTLNISIANISGLKRIPVFPEDIEKGINYKITPYISFSDSNGKPTPVTTVRQDFEDLYKSIDLGAKTIFLGEIGVGNREVLELIRDELVRKRGCKVFFNIVSSDEGDCFYDSEANNRFIQGELDQVFEPGEISMHLLNFKREALLDGLVAVAENNRDGFRIQVMGYFPKDLADIIIEGSRQDETHFRSLLEQIIPEVSSVSKERK